MSPINFYKGYYAIPTTVTINKTPEQFSTWNSVAKSAVFENKTEEAPTEQRRLHYNMCIRTYTNMYVCTYVWRILYIHTYVCTDVHVHTYLRIHWMTIWSWWMPFKGEYVRAHMQSDINCGIDMHVHMYVVICEYCTYVRTCVCACTYTPVYRMVIQSLGEK